MWALLGVAFVLGLVTAISPCVLPVLPVIFAAGTISSWRRNVAIVAGLACFFGGSTLLGHEVLTALGLPQDALNTAGIVLLLALAVGLIFEPVGRLLERPFSRFAVAPKVGASTRSGFLLGAGLGLVYVPCAGPVLAAISTASGNHRISWTAVAVTAAYVLGIAIPLLCIALASERLASTWSFVRTHARQVRQASGVLIGVMAILIATGVATDLATVVPGYDTTLQGDLVGPGVAKQLAGLSGEGVDKFLNADQGAAAASLPDLGRAPNFTNVTAWLNTPGGAPISLASLRGKVVLVDFWTYSCINCRRSLPHVEAWYHEYHRFGLDVIGVHTPEFPFEYVVSNVVTAAKSLGVTYPIDVDDGYGTWDAYHNNSWPSEYLIDQNGEVRHAVAYEGDYSTMEADIRALLEADGATNLPPPTDVPNRTPDSDQITQESYLGWYRLNNADNEVYPNKLTTYFLPSPLPGDLLAFGGQWTDDKYDAVAGAHAVLQLSYEADDVYLVLGGTGTVRVKVDGRPTEVLHVHGYPDLYTLLSGSSLTSGLLTLDVSKGVRAFDFTFG